MQDDNTQIPTWEMPPGSTPEKPAESDLKRASEFESALEDVEFAGNDGENGGNNEAIAAASSIVNYGANAACTKIGVQGVADKIERFDPSGYDDPIGAFYDTLEIENRDELNATKEREMENLDPAVSAKKISRENFIQAIKDFKDLVAETKSDPRFSELNDAASSFGTTVFDMASKKAAEQGGKPDFVGALNVLKAQKRAMEIAEKSGLDKEAAAEAVLNKTANEDSEEIPVPYENPEGDKLIEATSLLEKKIAEAEQFLFQNANTFSNEDKERFNKILSETKKVFEDTTSTADDRFRASDELDNIMEDLRNPNQQDNDSDNEKV